MNPNLSCLKASNSSRKSFVSQIQNPRAHVEDVCLGFLSPEPYTLFLNCEPSGTTFGADELLVQNAKACILGV